MIKTKIRFPMAVKRPTYVTNLAHLRPGENLLCWREHLAPFPLRQYKCAQLSEKVRPGLFIMNHCKPNTSLATCLLMLLVTISYTYNIY